jgi:hypothetical protein
MAQTKEGAEKICAAKIGMSAEEYRGRVLGGEKWCYRGSHWLPVDSFGSDSSRHDGLTAICLPCKREFNKSKYVSRPKVSKMGCRFAPVKDGDKKQARARVNFLVRTGRMLNPNCVPCFDCGHTGEDRRHEYDHFQGYAAEHQECVQVVCTTCHTKREMKRGKWGRGKKKDNGKN